MREVVALAVVLTRTGAPGGRAPATTAADEVDGVVATDAHADGRPAARAAAV